MDNIVDNIYSALNKQNVINSQIGEAFGQVGRDIRYLDGVTKGQRRINWILWAFTFGVGYICAKNIGELRAEIEELKHVKGV